MAVDVQLTTQPLGSLLFALSHPLPAPHPFFPASCPSEPEAGSGALKYPTPKSRAPGTWRNAPTLRRDKPPAPNPTVLLIWTLPALGSAVTSHPWGPTPGLGRGVPPGAGTLQNSAFWPLSGASSCHLPGVPLSPLYHANFSRDNFSTMSPPARTETLYGAGPREAAALPRQTKAHCCRRAGPRFQAGPAERPPPARAAQHLVRRLLAPDQDINQRAGRAARELGGRLRR